MLWHCNGWESILKMPKEDDLIDKSLYPSRIFSWSWLTLKPVRDDHQAAQVFSLSRTPISVFKKSTTTYLLGWKLLLHFGFAKDDGSLQKNRPDQNINHIQLF